MSEAAARPERAAEVERPWLAHYPPGVPPGIDEAVVPTLVDLFRESVQKFPQRPALESFGTGLTYEELGRVAGAVASWLQAQGLGRGDRVAMMMPNVLAYPAALFGALIAGCTVVNVNPLYTARELVHQLTDSGARVLFVLENFGHTVEEACPKLALQRIVVVKPGDLMGVKGAAINFVSRRVKRAVPRFCLADAVPFAAVLKAGSARPMSPVTVGPEDVAFLQYTGGTTGPSKGAVLLHRNVGANVVQIETWIAPFFGQGPHIMVTALPLYHVLALTGCCLFMVRVGGCQILVPNPRDIRALVKTLQKRPFTCMVLVNTLYNALANQPGMRKVDFSRLAFCVSGGMATQASVAKRWKELTGRPMVEGYGLSETSPVISLNRLDIEDFTGTIGYPIPATDVSVRSPDGEVLPLGEAGELCVRGPQVMPGYWNRPDETTAAMTADGFFRTGDAGVLLPDGQVKIVDRIKDMILVSGFNVYPNEVEDVLAGHPGVLEVAVIGGPDSHSGEMVVAYIVPRDPDVTEASVRAYARANLAPYKVPRRIEFRDSLPKTNVGKVLRRALRDELTARNQA
jgi:long-chain acyl-CoA synthetase